MVFEAILGWASIRRGAFIRGERLIRDDVYTLGKGGGGGGRGRLLDTRRLFESGRLLDHLWYPGFLVQVSRKGTPGY